MAAASLFGLHGSHNALYDATSAPSMPAPTRTASVAPLEFVVPFCTNAELACVSLLDREHERICEHEWRLRVLRRYGNLRYDTRAWRKCFKLRAHLEQKVVDAVTARVYLMNGRGETQCFPLPRGKSLMCSRERAVVYNRCERMFDLSLRINRSIQEISALIGMVSVDEARGLLNEHINLMTSVASLRGSLLFESELFQVFPAPVLLDANSLLRGTFSFPDASFLQSSTLMMQVWASIDGLIYRPLSPPTVIEHYADAMEEDVGENNGASDAQATAVDENGTISPTGTTAAEYHSVKLHDLSGMTIHIDDNTLRYKLHKNEICINALVSNTYLLYLFNPLNFRPLDWTFEAVIHVDAMRYVLPVQREGVFLNTTSYALRVFLSYGKISEKELQQDDNENGASTMGGSRSRGAETSEPLEIPYTCGVNIDDSQILSFCLTATNRITKETREVASKSACISVASASEEEEQEDAAPVAPTESMEPPASGEAQVEMVSEKENAMQQEDQDLVNMDTQAPLTSPRTTKTKTPAGPTERHVHLPRMDAMICYSFSPSRHLLQYVEFAIGFEPLMHQLGVSSFLPDASVVPVSA
ncbi:hypothetical protein FI667_g10291, partial [Globisporangium splendens]